MRSSSSVRAHHPRRSRRNLAWLAAISICVAGCAGGIASSYDQTFLSANHNWAFRHEFADVDALFNAFDYGHARLYETLWRTPAAAQSVLDEKEFRFITTKLLRDPPTVALDEAAIAPQWVKLAPEVAAMFDWAHMLHRQIYDVWTDDRIPGSDKDAQVARLIDYYKSRPALAFSSRPKIMNLMEGQPYSLSFRHRFPTYNGLIWSYHWLQMTLYDALLAGRTFAERRANVALVTNRFREMLKGGQTSLPAMMPMSPAIATRFSTRYPEAAIIFDNLHSLHDVVSDILSNPAVPRERKRQTILAAAAQYRDDTSHVTSTEAWRSMASEMGVGNMGGLPPLSRSP